MPQLSYTTSNGITVTRTGSKVPYSRGLAHLLAQLDSKRGVYLSSGYEYPERYSRWDIASVAPPLEIVGRGRRLELRALNERGEVLLCLLDPLLKYHPHRRAYFRKTGSIRLDLKPLAAKFPEEERSKQPSPFSILRTLVQEFQNPRDSRLLLIGAFGYDLLLQFDPIQMRLARERQTDLHLFLCDDIYFMDRKKETIDRFQYDFSSDKGDTAGLPRATPRVARAAASGRRAEIVSDHTPEEYMVKVETVREGMRQGNYYEVVLRQTFSAAFDGSPSELFQRVQKSSPSPYEFLLQMGDEQLVGASPEMFVRVEGEQVRLAQSPEPRVGRAIHCAMPKASASC